MAFRKLQNQGISVCVIVDEYDYLANMILYEAVAEYKKLVVKSDLATEIELALREFFAHLKRWTSDTLVAKVFMTGVSPMLLTGRLLNQFFNLLRVIL